MGKYGFDFSKEHWSALHRVPQLNRLTRDDFVVAGVTITDCGVGKYRLVDLNVSFVMKLGRGDFQS